MARDSQHAGWRPGWGDFRSNNGTWKDSDWTARQEAGITPVGKEGILSIASGKGIIPEHNWWHHVGGGAVYSILYS